ncbi:MAG: DUF3391 domain-containing protein [Betaproteobacteria bacterium]|nr:DUF3391 domain-containing protein [Betaproteobacteria bacterium]
MDKEQFPFISVDQLVAGLYIHLDLGWMDHPFTFNHFKIRTEEQIATLRALGLKQIRYDPAKSDIKPLAAQAKTSPPPTDTAPSLTEAASAANPAIKAKLERMERIKQQRQAIHACEKTFLSAANTVKGISKNIFSRPEQTIQAAESMIKQMVDSLLIDQDIAIHLMNDKIAGEEIYLHALNISVLSMILGKEMGLDPELIKALGIGAIFHDIGKIDIPDKVLLKTQALTKAEEDFLRQHVPYGLDIGKRVKLDKETMLIIAQHHEMTDGSGYPNGLKGEQISIPARIIGLVNVYDNLCNPVNISAAITPHEALSLMFSKQRNKFDANALKIMVHSLGVYPPGTVVTLSNDAIGMVMSVNSSKPLKPSVLIYDPDVPKDEAIIVDLEAEQDINISKALRPSLLPRPVYEYLSPRKRVTYYFDESTKKAGKP